MCLLRPHAAIIISWGRTFSRHHRHSWLLQNARCSQMHCTERHPFVTSACSDCRGSDLKDLYFHWLGRIILHSGELILINLASLDFVIGWGEISPRHRWLDIRHSASFGASYPFAWDIHFWEVVCQICQLDASGESGLDIMQRIWVSCCRIMSDASYTDHMLPNASKCFDMKGLKA